MNRFLITLILTIATLSDIPCAFGANYKLTLLAKPGDSVVKGQPLFVIERPHVAIDLHEVLGELRLARAQVLPRGGHH